KKIVVSTLGLVMGAALVGSISGSVAWYQYSTRAAASMTATSAGTSRKLEIKQSTAAADAWSNKVTSLAGNLKPITVGDNVAADAASITKFYDKPIYQYAQSGKDLGAPSAVVTNGYALSYTFDFRVRDKVDGAAEASVAGKPIYLQDVQLTGLGADETKIANANKLASAIRIHVSGKVGENNVGAVLAKDVASTNLYGNLDLGGASGADTMDADFSDSSTTKITYGKIASGQTAPNQKLSSVNLSSEGTNHTVLVNDADPYALADGLKLCETTADDAHPAQVTILVWLEGWGMVNSSATWDYATYIQSQVKLDFRFVTQAD
nr:hypothetical protein [Bacilli bacterium]